MTDKENKRNLDPERIGQNEERETTDETDFNAGGNSSDYDGAQPKDSEQESDGRIKNGEEYARRQHGKDEIDKESFNAGGNDSDYDGGHPNDSSSDSQRKNDSDKN